MNSRPLYLSVPGSRLSLVMMFMFFLSACAHMSPVEKEIFDEIDNLNRQFSQNEENALYHIKLAQQYEKLGKEKKSRFWYQKSIKSYQKAIKLNPENNNLKLSLYQLTYTGVVEWYADFELLVEIYGQLDPVFKKGLGPPHLALYHREYARSLYGAVSQAQLQEMLFKALEESPAHPQVVYFLSDLLVSNEQYLLAVDMLERSLREYPDSVMTKFQLGLVYEAYANRDYCPYEYEHLIKKSLMLFQESAQKITESPYLNYMLTKQFQRINSPFMMVDAAKRLVKLEPGNQSQFLLAEAYAFANLPDKADEIYQHFIQNYVPDALRERAVFLSENGRYEEAYLSSSRFLETGAKMEIYSALLHLSLQILTSNKLTPYQEINRIVDTDKLSEWEIALLFFMYDLKTEATMNTLADNICKKTEYNFLKAMKLIAENNTVDAHAILTELLDSKTYSFIEYRVAKKMVLPEYFNQLPLKR